MKLTHCQLKKKKKKGNSHPFLSNFTQKGKEKKQKVSQNSRLALVLVIKHPIYTHESHVKCLDHPSVGATMDGTHQIKQILRIREILSSHWKILAHWLDGRFLTAATIR